MLFVGMIDCIHVLIISIGDYQLPHYKWCWYGMEFFNGVGWKLSACSTVLAAVLLRNNMLHSFPLRVAFYLNIQEVNGIAIICHRKLQVVIILVNEIKELQKSFLRSLPDDEDVTMYRSHVDMWLV